MCEAGTGLTWKRPLPLNSTQRPGGRGGKADEAGAAGGGAEDPGNQDAPDTATGKDGFTRKGGGKRGRGGRGAGQLSEDDRGPLFHLNSWHTLKFLPEVPELFKEFDITGAEEDLRKLCLRADLSFALAKQE